MNQSCYYDEEEQDESLCLPFQEMQHGVSFDLTPNNRVTPNGDQGTQRIILAEKEIPLEFDGRKLFLNIRRPSNEELELLPSYELTSPNEFIPDASNDVTTRRTVNQNIQHQYPGKLTLEEWRNRLALAPEEVVKKTFEATTQMAMSVEAESRDIPRRHYISRFPFLKEKRVNDIFHTDTFFPSVNTNKGETCSQLFIGQATDYMSVYPLKSESHNHTALQDFGRSVGIPSGIKSDNARSEKGQKWVEWCRKYCVSQSFTEPKSPWQNYAKQGIGNLGRMVKRYMRKFQVPLSRHGWCQLWCKDVRNHLASRKLNWRTPTERLTGDTPDISMFRFHFWEPIEFYDHTVKQPTDGWTPGRFLGIAWESGDAMTYYIEPDTSLTNYRNMILIHSTVRSKKHQLAPASSPPPSGETHTDTDLSFGNEGGNDDDDATIPIQPSNNTGNNNGIHVTNNNDPPDLAPDDAAIADEQVVNHIHPNDDGMDFEKFTGYHWDNGTLILEITLLSGKQFDAPFTLIKKDRPVELAKFIEKEVVEPKRGGYYEKWAKGILKHSGCTI